ncbi:MAG: ATP-binding protein, partial [Microcoleaceae cyanobacterium]
EGVVKVYGLEKYQNTLVMFVEDFGGESWKILRETYHFSLGEFLSIARKIARSLGQIHANHIIHKDINPANIVINPKTQQLKIIDLGISTRLTRENPTLKNPNVLEGTLPYISPEQTGRMNRFLDYRTDFYSLGVTFYEVLTNQLPFETKDNLELVHFHLAKTPVFPTEINPLIPPVISNIVMKLMAKNAEERYQSAWGLKADLEKCLSQLELTGNIADFTLASQDISDQFQIPQKLYGRESEIERLITAFERVSDRPPTGKGGELMLIAGYSGIGKSALVQEIYKPITEKRGYFIAGKFDQFQRNIPYSAIVNAFQQLVKQILTENSAQINLWKTKLLAAFGGKGQVIIDVIPEVELIIGKQSPVPELGATASQNRFNLVCQNFLRACCAKEHPLVIFLDDLQWADGATLKLIELMMTDRNLQYFFLIGAYRDNELSIGHPLIIMLDELRKSQVIINQITLSDLGLEDIMRMLVDTLKSDRARVQSLGELVLKKTGGNPFFVKQFLKLLYTEHLIDFAYDEQIWQWNQARIEAQDITDNVVELMIGKLKKLPKATQSILQLAACIGANFDLHTLSVIGKTTPSEIFTNLMPAIDSRLILPLSELDEQL